MEPIWQKHQEVVQCNSRPWHTYCRGFSHLWYTFWSTQESDWLANIVCPCECSLDQSSLRRVPAWCWPGLLGEVFYFLRFGNLLEFLGRGFNSEEGSVGQRADLANTLPTLDFFCSFDCGCCSHGKKNWTVGLKRQRGNSAAKRKKLKMFCPHD